MLWPLLHNHQQLRISWMFQTWRAKENVPEARPAPWLGSDEHGRGRNSTTGEAGTQ